jgi:hypothetical protein
MTFPAPAVLDRCGMRSNASSTIFLASAQWG